MMTVTVLLYPVMHVKNRFVVVIELWREGTVVALLFFFFNDTATTEIYTLSLHDALPISSSSRSPDRQARASRRSCTSPARSEEHTSELQSRQYLVCRLLLEKKKKKK